MLNFRDAIDRMVPGNKFKCMPQQKKLSTY